MTTTQQTELTSTPCIDVCVLDAEGNCTGCARTTREIACWSAIGEADRLEIMRELPARIAAMGNRAAEPEEALALIEAVLKRRSKG